MIYMKKIQKYIKNTRLQSAMVVSWAGNLITDHCYGSLAKAGSETGRRILCGTQPLLMHVRKLLPVPVHEFDHI